MRLLLDSHCEWEKCVTLTSPAILFKSSHEKWSLMGIINDYSVWYDNEFTQKPAE